MNVSNTTSNYGDYSTYNVEVLEKEEKGQTPSSYEEVEPSQTAKRQREDSEEEIVPAKKRNIAKVLPRAEAVGTLNPIDLPLMNICEISKTIGERIAQGDEGVIYEVKGSDPARVYKMIPNNRFKNGDEIRISRIAGETGVGPLVHQALLVQQKAKKFVVIEMDDAGRSLGQCMEDFAEEEVKDNPQEAKVEEDASLTAEERARREKMRQIREMVKAKYNFDTVIKKKKRVTLEQAIEKIYCNRDGFYCDLFTKIKELAENKISYGDLHVGNIMPHYGSNASLQLIDFGSAKMHESVKEAVMKSMNSAYTHLLFNKFEQISNHSDESRKVIEWLLEQQRGPSST